MTSRDRRAGWLRSWPVLIALFLIPSSAWAISNPMFAVPDEPAHVTKAVATWYGQIGGRNTLPGTGLRTYRIPAYWAPVNPCFAFHADTRPNQCPPNLQGSHRVTDVSTPSGAYPPLYFVLVGWPSRLFADLTGIYLMRLVSALVCSMFLAAAVKALQQAVRPCLAVAGVLVATTPMALFLAGSVNPSGFEIATAIALWAHVLATARRAEHGMAAIPRSLLIGLFVSGSAMALTRPLSGPFAGLIVVLGLLSTTWPTLVAMARSRRVQITVVGLAVVCVAALGMVYATGIASGKVVGGSAFPPAVDHWTFVLGSTPWYVQQMFGQFGWLDVPPSNLTLYVWLGLVFALIAGAVMLAKLRQSLALALTLVAMVAIPVFLQAPMTGSASLIWQGRYTLPVAVGIPLLALVNLDRGAGLVPGLARRLSLVVAATVGVLSAHALYWNLHRYTVGRSSATVNILLGKWQPPGGSALWVVVMVLAAALGVVVVAFSPDRSPLPDAAGEVDGDDDDQAGSPPTSLVSTD